MTTNAHRVVNDHIEYVGTDYIGDKREPRYQFTNDAPSRRKYESPAAAMRDAEALVHDVVGHLAIEDEGNGQRWRMRVVFERCADGDGGRKA